MGDVTCKHCGRRIVQQRLTFGTFWTHQPAGAAFQDGMHEFCYLTSAEPDDPTQEASPR